MIAFYLLITGFHWLLAIEKNTVNNRASSLDKNFQTEKEIVKWDEIEFKINI